MTIKNNQFRPTESIKIAHRKENARYYETYKVVVFDQKRISKYHDGFFELVDLRIYYSSGLRVTACAWINDSEKELHASGSGSVGGGNYHKASAAASNALEACGLEFTEEVSGRGDEVIKEALASFAAWLGYKHFTVIKSHS